ncbi:MAG: flagellar biosynthetic protein FliQ [Candidatus Wallbacteria bacterium]|nr:flagellar biosynthetic protein FliQ [Candidatus Wallbacteria bacterium]
MDEFAILDLLGKNLELAFTLALPLAGTALLVGIVASLLQTVTSVHEPNLAFLPKLVAVALVACATGPTLVAQLVRHTVDLLSDFSRFIH